MSAGGVEASHFAPNPVSNVYGQYNVSTRARLSRDCEIASNGTRPVLQSDIISIRRSWS